MSTTRTFSALAILIGTAAGAACSGNGDNAQSGHLALSAAQCATATPWAPWVAYATGDLVSYDGVTYECVQGHTSEPTWTPDAVPALWEPGTCAGGSGSGSGGSGVGSSGGAVDA